MASLRRKLCYALKNGSLRDASARQLRIPKQHDPQKCPMPLKPLPETIPALDQPLW